MPGRLPYELKTLAEDPKAENYSLGWMFDVQLTGGLKVNAGETKQVGIAGGRSPGVRFTPLTQRPRRAGRSAPDERTGRREWLRHQRRERGL
jgi:hypothetical protein